MTKITQFSIREALVVTTMAAIVLSLHVAGYLTLILNPVCFGALVTMVFVAFHSTKRSSSASSDPVVFLLFLFLVFVLGFGATLIADKFR